jgi:hypothetical protein
MTSLAPRIRHPRRDRPEKLPAHRRRKQEASPDSDVGQALEQEKITALVDGFRGSTSSISFSLMAFIAVRRGEVFGEVGGLRCTQILSAPSNTPKSSDCSSKPPKSERGERPIKIDDTLIALLLKLRDKYLRIQAGAPSVANIDLSLGACRTIG